MSIRTVFVAAMLAVCLIPAVLIGAIGVYSINTSVRSEAQSRVNQDLEIVLTSYREQIARLAYAVESSSSRIVTTSSRESIETLTAIKRELDLTVLNLCDSEGRPLAGSYPEPHQRIPLGNDLVLRKALEGKTAWGTVVLDPNRLHLEGGPALTNAVVVHDGEDGGQPVCHSGLMWWIACPITDKSGRVTALLYGGRMLNFNDELVDKLRDTIFREREYKGKPRGTVTIFLDDVRIATNVHGRHKSRAIGTRVSDTVRETVLEQGLRYTGEALVVDAWYLSAYIPVEDMSGKTIGMLYVGMLRNPYDDMQTRLIAKFLIPVVIVALLVVYAALIIVNRITSPVRALSYSASRLASGDLEHVASIPHTYRELKMLASVFEDMQAAIRKRDQELRSQNEELGQTNQKLAVSNRNYMETLGFVTHELKAPLSSIQMLISTMMEGYVGELSPKVTHYITRIQHNCEELQDMVRDYLDLSRLERGELIARMAPLDLIGDVVTIVVQQTAIFYHSRKINLSVDCPDELPIVADQGLLQIALNNYLTNAAKYGREEGTATLTVSSDETSVTISVRNDGDGFLPHDATRLFEKFYRIRNQNTQSKRGSGIGLFTVKNIAELHGGRVWAESKAGEWAAFHISLPLTPPEQT